MVEFRRTMILRFSDGEMKPVTEPRFGDDVSRLRRFRLELLAKLVDHDMQILRLIAVVGSPDRLENLYVRNRDIRVRNKVLQNFKLLGSKAYVPSMNREMATA